MGERSQVYNRIFNEEDWDKVNKENKIIMQDYLEEYKQRKMKPTTLLQYHNDLRIVLLFILHELNNRSILELNKKDFRRFNLWLQDKGMSNARVNRLMSSVRSMLTYVEDDDDYEYDFNVAKKVKGLPKQAVRTDEEDFFLTYEQVIKVRNYLIEHEEWQLCSLWMLFYDSGARRNEVYQCKKQGILDGNKSNIVIGKRGKAFPLVYLNDTRDEVFAKYLEERGEDNIDSMWIIGSGDNKRPASYESIYDRVVPLSKILSELEGKEINFFCHSLRHTRCEHLLQGLDPRIIDKNTGKPKKFTLEEVQLFLHHSDPKTTQGYAKDHTEQIIDEMFDFS
jgi:site-specific recombinase XerD